MIKGNFKYIFFDADDTLWENECYFREAEHKFASLFSDRMPEDEAIAILSGKQEENIPLFGYGSKTFLIGMLDAAAAICGEGLNSELYFKIKRIITDLAQHEFHLIDGVEEVLETLSKKYILAVATKGDLSEQLHKYRESGLERYFHHIEVMQNKCADDYIAMAKKLDIVPEDILMVGNAVKSDIAPVIAIGGTAVHIPCEVTWHHEVMELPQSERVYELDNIKDLPKLLL